MIDSLILAACCVTLGAHLALIYWAGGEREPGPREHLRIRFEQRLRWMLDCCARTRPRKAWAIRGGKLIMYRRLDWQR